MIYLAFISSSLARKIQGGKKRRFCRLWGQNKSCKPGCLKCCAEKLSLSIPKVLCSPSSAHFYFPARKTRNKPAKNGLQQPIIAPKTKAPHNRHIPALQLFIALFFPAMPKKCPISRLYSHSQGNPSLLFNHFILFFSVFSSPGLRLHLCC